jgi:hypothetical protein
MKTALTRALFAGLATFVIISCRKSDVPDQSQSRVESTEATVASPPAIRLENGSLLGSSGVTITAPEQVNVDETFDIIAAVSCGKIGIERGYIEVNGTKIYKDLNCSTADLQWEEFVQYQCYTDDASRSWSFQEAGTYVFRTKHNGSDGNCDELGGQNRNGECSFNGNLFCCFMIEAVDGCETSFTGKTDLCENGQRSVTYTFTSEEALDYF